MTITVSPTELNPTHHVKLTDGSTDIGLILSDMYGNANASGFTRNPNSGTIKMYTGEAKYDDGAPPWTPQSITDFSGGLGGKIFDDDKTRHYWGKRAYTGNGAFEIGPQPVWTGGMYKFWPYFHNALGLGIAYTWHQFTTQYPSIAVSFVASATTAITRYYFVTRGAYSIEASLYTNNSGRPGSLVHTSTTGSFIPSGDHRMESKEVVLDVTGVNLTISNTYWLVITETSIGSDSGSYILCATNSSSMSGCKKGTSASAWTAITTYKPMFVLYQTVPTHKLHYFELKGALHAALEYDGSAESSLYINGDCGVAASGSTTTIVSATAGHKVTWADNALIGSVVVLTGGTGSTQPRNFRLITGNTTSGGNLTITCSLNEPWDVAPASGTEWAVVANNTWTAVTEVDTLWNGQKVTDVLAVNGAAYFAHGDAYAMTRLMIYNNAGAWTYDVSQESTTSVEAYATKLAAANDVEGAFIWKARGGFPSKIAKAPVVDCTGTSTAADLVFEAEINAGDLGARITNMLEYGEYGNLHILKENNLLQVINSSGTDYVYKIPISAFPNTKDYRNGRAAVVHDTYLYFSWHDTVLRYYRNYLDNIGPNSSDLTIPSIYRGVVSKLCTYPGMLIASIDGGVYNYSSVLGYNGTGWFNLFTAPEVGQRIQSIYIQPIPGDNVDRLWISCGNTSLWIPISTNPFNHSQVQYNFYCTAWDATMDMGYMYAGRRKLYKYWRAMEFDEDQVQELYLYAHNATSFTGSSWSTGTSLEEASIGETSTYLSPDITICSRNNRSPVKINALIFDAVTREKMRWINTLTFRVADMDKDLNGDYDDYQTIAGKLAVLAGWSETTPTVLTMTSVASELNGKSVIIEFGGMRPHRIVTDDGKQVYLMQLICNEV